MDGWMEYSLPAFQPLLLVHVCFGDVVIPHTNNDKTWIKKYCCSMLWNKLLLAMPDPSLSPTQFCAVLKIIQFCSRHVVLGTCICT